MKILKYIFILAGVAMIAISCEVDDPPFQQSDVDLAFNYRMQRDVTSFNILDTDPAVNLTVFSNSENIASVDLMSDIQVFDFDDPANSPLTPRALIRTVNQGEFDDAGSLQISLTLQEIVDAIGFPIDSLKGGDIINLYNVVRLENGNIYPDTIHFENGPQLNVENAFYTTTTSSFNALLPFPISCPSDLETGATYQVITTVDNTCCGLPTGEFTGNTATVTKKGERDYEITDFLNGYFAPFGGGDEALVVTDVCNIITVNGSDCPASSFLCYIPNSTNGFGSYDPVTDTWTIQWEDAFGNNIRGTTILRP